MRLEQVFQKVKIPIEITDLFLYRPVYHEPAFEDFEPITDVKRLAIASSSACTQFVEFFHVFLMVVDP